MSRHYKSETKENALVPNWTYFVEVCGFTFHFNSLEQIEGYLNYYQKKIHPSSADGIAWGRLYSKGNDGEVRFLSRGDHWERQTPFDELPLYLREEPKRQKVIKALERALQQWRAETDKT